MKVIKRDGRLQDFDIGKIKTSLICASDTAHMELNESDIKIILEDVEKLIKAKCKDGAIASEKIVEAIVSTLKKDEFNKLVETFTSYKK